MAQPQQEEAMQPIKLRVVGPTLPEIPSAPTMQTRHIRRARNPHRSTGSPSWTDLNPWAQTYTRARHPFEIHHLHFERTLGTSVALVEVYQLSGWAGHCIQSIQAQSSAHGGDSKRLWMTGSYLKTDSEKLRFCNNRLRYVWCDVWQVSKESTHHGYVGRSKVAERVVGLSTARSVNAKRSQVWVKAKASKQNGLWTSRVRLAKAFLRSKLFLFLFWKLN
jgi:hypothetical protein